MLTRRTLLQLALALAALPRPLGAAPRGRRLAGPLPAAGLPPAETFIIDTRFPVSVAAAREAARQGTPVHAVAGDVTALWYHDLYFRWRRGQVVIAGMTGVDALFCLDLLARDAQLRVLARTDHDDGLVSWVIGPKPARASRVDARGTSMKGAS